MLLKRITAATLDEALKQVRSECGEHALIVETRHTAGGCLVIAARPPARGSREVARAAPVHRWTRGFSPLAERALGFGISNRVITAVEDALIGTRVSLDRPGDPALPGIATRVLEALIQVEPLALPGHRVLSFVGPTGVGKTTTLAKLAARMHREHHEDLAILSLDTYRIAAVEQLRAFADMLEVPFEVAFTPLDLRTALDRHRDRDRVLIDTTGRGPFDLDQINLMAGALGVARTNKSLLCIPAGLRRADAEAVLEAYQRLVPTAVILTKWDETQVPGETLSLLVEQGLPLSHVAIGQEVPDDIVVADGLSLAANAFGLGEEAAERVLQGLPRPQANLSTTA